MRITVLVILLATAFMALTAFECASTEMTTARVALQNRDLEAAIASLQKEVGKRPGNAEAWLMLAEIYELQQRPIDAANAIENARSATQPALTPIQRGDTYIRLYNLWRSTYNRALEHFKKDEYKRALAVLDTAEMLDRTQWENRYFRATLYDALGDEKATRTAYEEYVKEVTPDIERGVALGLAMGLTPGQVKAKLGTPTAEKLDESGGVMYYKDHDLYVYVAPLEGRVVVEGWRQYAADVPDPLRQIGVSFRTRPFIQLGQAAYKEAQETKERQAYDRALKHFQLLTRFDPEVKGVSSLVANIYNETGRTDEAIRLLQAEIAANPKSPRAYLELGNLHVPVKRYQEAADAFARVLDLGLPETDNSVKLALFNLGAVYKNWGADIQRSVNESVKDRTKITAAQQETYLKPLRESTKYFERLRLVSPDDIGVLSELANLYYVMQDDAKTNALIQQLEGYADRHANSKSYWYAMSRLYAVVFGDEAKATAAERKAEAATEP